MRAEKASVERLLKTARGQLDGILRMVEENRYCVEIANQLLATQSILKKANREILLAHVEGCIRESMEQGNSEEKLRELLLLVDRLSQ